MKNLGYYNGRFGEIEDMTVPMNDRACYFGDGVYEASLVKNYHIFALDDHIERFYNSAGLLRITISQTKEELKAILREMVGKMDYPDQLLYWQASRGTAPRSHTFPAGVNSANIWITIKPGQLEDVYKPLKLITMEDTRFLHCNIKTLNLLPNVMAAQAAAEACAAECILHRGETVTECSHSNVSILKDGIFRTHPADQYILPGITRKHLIQLCKDHNIPVSEVAFTMKELLEADEVIVSSSSHLCIPAYEVDGVPVGGRAPELLKLLQDSYMKKFMDETR